MGKFAGFQSQQLVRPQRSVFDLSHYKRTSTRMGRLTPVFISEAIPGDSFQGSSEILLRLAPLLAPIYDNIQLFVHFFFVPNRLLWEDWEEFITGGIMPGSEPVNPPIPPYVPMSELYLNEFFNQPSQLLDYLGVPPSMWALGPDLSDWTGKKLDALPVLACSKVYFDYYRDRNYEYDDNYVFPAPSGDLSTAVDFNWENHFKTQTRNYMHDYFTSSLPFTQRGQEVNMPVLVSGDLPLVGNPLNNATAYMRLKGEESGPVDTQYGIDIDTSGAIPNGDVVARLNEVSSSTSINDFRSAYALQVWLERNAVGGSRYNENTLAHFGVRIQDQRLQRSEYLGGGRIPVKISEIVSTAYSSDGTATVPLANLAGHGITYGNTNGFRYFCPEHGFIIAFASIMNEPSYHQGLPRMFYARRTFLGYPWPTFAKLGEQQVDKAELYADPTNLTEDANGELPLFGYQSRYSDWKILHNSNHGEFRSTLLFWTLTRHFATSPELGQDFVRFDDNSQDRIFAVNTGTDNFWMYVHNKVTVKRALPYFGAPNNLGFQ